MSDFKDVQNAIESAKNVLVAAHRDPDGDAIGSLLAASFYLGKINKPFYAFSVSGVPEMFKLLPGIELIKDNVPSERYDLVLGLDYGVRDRLGLEEYFAQHGPSLLALDHHPKNGQLENFGVIDTSYPSTCELMFDYFKAAGFTLNQDIAKALMTGLLTDTGFFKYTAKPESLERALSLMKDFGVGIAEIEHLLYGHQKLDAVKLGGRILARTAYHEAGFNYSYILLDDLVGGLKVDDVAGVAERIRNIDKGRFALLLIEEPGGVWRGRLRSGQDKSLDLSELAKKLGGGGHKEASGFRTEGQIDDILETVAKYSRE